MLEKNPKCWPSQDWKYSLHKSVRNSNLTAPNGKDKEGEKRKKELSCIPAPPNPWKEMVLVTQRVTSTISLFFGFIFIQGYCARHQLIAKAVLLSYRYDHATNFWGVKPDPMHSCHWHLPTLTQCSGMHHGGSLVSPNTCSTLSLLPHSLYDSPANYSELHDFGSFHRWRSCKTCVGLSYCCQHYCITLDISFISLQKNSMPLSKACSNMSLQLSLVSNELVKLTPKSSMRQFWDLLPVTFLHL